MAASSGDPGGRPIGRRPLCEGCRRPLAGCWCACVRPVENRSALLILQDPQEAGQAKGTAALLARCLARVSLRVGERFDPPTSTANLVLLYPETPGDATLAAPGALDVATRNDGEPLTLVVLDGTWRRSRRLLHLNPWLLTLPRLSLETPPPSRYAIRRAQGPAQRSTLEACALALATLDGDPARYQPLWRAMDDFVALQQRLADAPPPRDGGGAR
ncbi:DTW domain-containing protein [Mitsuaria sp. GD03876]|uniref:tRNA-uridine aminocarboxypropyltransferase n=1 Tax=Mitsuaria sp. GD03876 TaxID=2975399 RepID=UPI00244B9DCB|nr:DTW domain-containing protein [Mitsuaria sp. GD03876]MDH0864798.1 DTW domain-containing protein [Mitsuaria sp. GD03876]